MEMEKDISTRIEESSIKSDDFNNAIGEAIFATRGLPTHFNVVETKSAMVLQSGTVFTLSDEGYMTDQEMEDLIESFSKG